MRPIEHLSERDRAHFDEAVRLIRDVLDAHPDQLTGPLWSAFEVAVHGVRVVEHYLDETR